MTWELDAIDDVPVIEDKAEEDEKRTPVTGDTALEVSCWRPKILARRAIGLEVDAAVLIG